MASSSTIYFKIRVENVKPFFTISQINENDFRNQLDIKQVSPNMEDSNTKYLHF